jgi:hypothetical protein
MRHHSAPGALSRPQACIRASLKLKADAKRLDSLEIRKDTQAALVGWSITICQQSTFGVLFDMD